jgi:hypothetical protein
LEIQMSFHEKSKNRVKKIKPGKSNVKRAKSMAADDAASPPVVEPVMHRLLRLHGASDEQIAGFEALTGDGRAPDHSTMSSPILRGLAGQLLEEGLEQIAHATGDTMFIVRRYQLPGKGSAADAVNFRTFRSEMRREMNAEFEHAFCLIAPYRENGSVTYAATIVGTRASLANGLLSAGPARARRRSRTIVPPSEELVLPISEESRRVIAAALFGSIEYSMDPPGPVRFKKDARYRRVCAAFNCHIARALLPIDRSIYGIGLGKKLAQGIARTIKARASLLDIAGRSLVRPEGVASFLASLPADKKGNRVVLPVIRTL